MGFANLRTLENRLSSLKSNLSSYNTQLDKQRRRKENIESIIKEMKRICSNRTDDVNTHLNKMINNYEDAAKGVASTSTLLSTTTTDKEKDISEDDSMSNALSQLQSELNDVCRKIGELEGEIQVCKSQISTCESSIRSEKRNIAQDYQRQFNSAQARVNTADAACKADPTNVQLKQEFDRACRARDSARITYNKYKGWL
jgi:chromosome segregation ATPase